MIDFEKIDKIDGGLTKQEAKLLFKYAKKAPLSKILELGSFIGKSTVVLAKASNLVVACDLFPENFKSWNQPEVIYESTIKAFWENLKKFNVENNVIAIRENHSNIDSKIYGKWGMIYIDGDHSIRGILSDANFAWNNVIENGFIVFHDYNESCCPDVKTCVDVLCNKWKTKILEKSGTMVIIQKGG